MLGLEEESCGQSMLQGFSQHCISDSRSCNRWDITEHEHGDSTDGRPPYQPKPIASTVNTVKHESHRRDEFDDAEDASEEESGGDGSEAC